MDNKYWSFQLIRFNCAFWPLVAGYYMRNRDLRDDASLWKRKELLNFPINGQKRVKKHLHLWSLAQFDWLSE